MFQCWTSTAALWPPGLKQGLEGLIMHLCIYIVVAVFRINIQSHTNLHVRALHSQANSRSAVSVLIRGPLKVSLRVVNIKLTFTY